MTYTGAKASFNAAAEQYDRSRPSYPGEMVAHIVRTAGLGADSRILEVGAGTGKASMLFARYGYPMLCLEPGPSMSEIAKINLQPFPRASVETVTFEDWPVEEHGFDLLISGQAFHWVDPAIGPKKAAQALKPGGWIALFWNLSDDPEGGIYDEIQKAYEEIAPELTRRYKVKLLSQEVEELNQVLVDNADIFDRGSVERFDWTRAYSAKAYISLLSTYSDHIQLEDERRTRLFDAISKIIQSHSGTIVKGYACTLLIAQTI